MAVGAVIEDSSNRKLFVIFFALLFIQILFSSDGAWYAPSPSTFIKFELISCWDETKGISEEWIHRDNCFKTSQLSNFTPSSFDRRELFFVANMPHAKDGVQLKYVFYFPLRMLQVSVIYSEHFKRVENAQMELEVGMGHRERNSTRNDWKELMTSNATRALECTFEKEEKKEIYDCDTLDLAELGSSSYPFYLVNIRIPIEQCQFNSNSYKCQIRTRLVFQIVEVHQDTVLTLLWFWRKILMILVVLVSLWWYYNTVSSSMDEEEHDTNWCDMPPKIKLMCIEKMNFKMRCQLRQTARAENRLVDSLKYKFRLFDFFDSHLACHSTAYRKEESYIFRDFHRCIPYILNHCEVVVIKVGDTLDFIDFVQLETVLKPKKISWTFVDHKMYKIYTVCRFFETCWNQVEKIQVLNATDNFPFKKFFAIPSVFNAKALFFNDIFCDFHSTSLIPLIEKWIEVDAPVGTKLDIYICSVLLDLAPLIDRLQFRVISLTESMLRITTDNPNKHILMYPSFNAGLYFCVTVIPSDFVESQYSE